jgi:enamine deaminase RidA (YjgF/YER057c/UK114 family)
MNSLSALKNLFQHKSTMNNRINISSGSPWEDIVGYSRAVRIGNIIEVAGTTAVDGDVLIGGDSMYEQTKFILQKIEKALIAAGASMSDVVRTRVYVTDISKWEEVGRAHGEVFKTIKPASAMVQVSALINKHMLVEIEATAILSKK